MIVFCEIQAQINAGSLEIYNDYDCVMHVKLRHILTLYALNHISSSHLFMQLFISFFWLSLVKNKRHDGSLL